MKTEYLIFNFVVLLGPLMMSFEQKMHFVARWPRVFRAIFLALIPFALWDHLVTGRHWWFNHEFTLNYRLLGLPPGEWLFFIAVPFAALFVWEVLKFYFKNREINAFTFNRWGGLLGGSAGLILFLAGKEYTGLVVWAMTAVAGLDQWLGTRLLRQRRTWQYLAILTGLTFIFNSYLTGRPIVLYDPQYQLDWRIGTVPVEDFFFGFTHILLCTIVYEKK